MGSNSVQMNQTSKKILKKKRIEKDCDVESVGNKSDRSNDFVKKKMSIKIRKNVENPELIQTEEK